MQIPGPVPGFRLSRSKGRTLKRLHLGVRVENSMRDWCGWGGPLPTHHSPATSPAPLPPEHPPSIAMSLPGAGPAGSPGAGGAVPQGASVAGTSSWGERPCVHPD